MISKKITEDILTTRCSRCDKAYLEDDFSGCGALRCSACGAALCCWCQADCGSDAHKHVVNCPESKQRGDIFVNKALVKQHIEQRKRDRVLAELEKYPKERQIQIRNKLGGSWKG